MSNVIDCGSMLKDEAVKLIGSQAALARLLGVTRGAVWHWVHLPQSRVWQLKLLKPEWFTNDKKPG